MTDIAPKIKMIRRKISGVFLLNKPLGISSNAALQRVKWLFRADKAGHTGALDPLASGLLPICLGEATKFSHFLLDASKCYQTTIQLGRATSTGDVEGDVVEELPVPELNEALILDTLQGFLGAQQQIPPMYSALKKDGQPLYKLAREGITIERAARDFMVDNIQLIEFTPSSITLQISCSKGTYIRVLGEDIAKALGTCGHLTWLHRTQTGNFVLNPSYTIEYLESLTEPEREVLLLPLYAPVDDLPKIELTADEAFYFGRGQSVRIQHEQGLALAFLQQKCLGLGLIDELSNFQPKRLMVD